MQIITGPAKGAGSFNHLARIPLSQWSVSPALSSNFPAANLIDGNTEVPIGLFSVIQNPTTITADLDLLAHTGDFEGASIAPPWTILLGTAVIDATYHSGAGAQSAKLGVSSTLAANLTVRCGEQVSLPWAISSDGVTTTARLRILNLDTGYYLNSSNVWVNAVVDYATQTGSKAFASGTAVFTVQPYGNSGLVGTQSFPTTIQIQVLNTLASGNVWIDSTFCWPSTSFGGLFGHNVPPAIVTTLQSSPDNSAWTTQATFNSLKPNMWASLYLQANSAGVPWVGNPFATRYVRINMAGNFQTAPWAAQAVLSQLSAQASFPLASGIAYDYDTNQIRNVTPSGKQFVSLLAGKRRTATLTYQILGILGAYLNQQPLSDWRDSLLEQSQMGANPLIILAPEFDLDFCVWGLLEPKASLAIKQISEREGKITIKEEPYAYAGVSVTA